MRFLNNLVRTLVLLVLVAAVGFLGWLTAVEYMPDPVEEATRTSAADAAQRNLKRGEELTVLNWNIGYAGLGKEADFFMDGGSQSKPADQSTVHRYLDGIARTIAANAPDLVLLQEVDADSSRTYRIDERQFLNSGMSSTAYALNYSCAFVPIPWPPIGRVNSGLYTMTAGLTIDEAERIALPCPFSWPMRIANLKRCLLVSRLPVEGSDRELVLVNLHLEAYDDGAGKIAQTRQLRAYLQDEYEKGNYVIAGGDFNQVFPGSLDRYPNTHPKEWEPGVLDEALLPAGWTLAYDLTAPSCRLLNQPYDPGDTVGTQYYVIDGLILSPNVEMKAVQTLDMGFEFSDHNPVRLSFALR